MRSVQHLEGSRQNELARFGRMVPVIQRAIQKYEDRFRVVPLGPIARHINIDARVRGEWGGAIEAFLGERLLL